MQIVVFSLGSEHYAIDTRFIDGIDKILQVTKVPNVSYYIKGLANLRGNIISIVSLKAYLNIESNTPEENTLIFNKDGEQIGLLVDQVVKVINIDESEIESLGNPAEHVVGVINKDDDIITLLEGETLLS